jgi:hypothetical protein
MEITNQVIDQALQRLHYHSLEKQVRLPAPHELDRLQMEYGCTLSTDYRYFLSHYGPGSFEGSGLLLLPSGSPIGTTFTVDIIYGVGGRKNWDPFALLASTYEQQLPPHYLPIATDPGGNLLLLACGADKIFAWDHEHRELSNNVLDDMINELAAGGLEVEKYDIAQIILMWENIHPERIKNPSGHGNLYPVADSFAQLLQSIRPHPDYS